MILVKEVMLPPAPLTADSTLASALAALDDRAGAFVVDERGVPTAVLTAADAIRAAGEGETGVAAALRTDFETCSADNTLSDVYALAGKGLPIAACDDSGALLGNLDPRLIMEEMGRVESLAEGFEREVYM